jgi:von Willebrand factor type A domain
MFYLNAHLLYFVPVAALLAGLLVFVNYRRKRAMQLAYGDAELLAESSKPLGRGRYIARGIFAALTAALLTLSLARPVINNGTKSIAVGTVDVIAVVDVSRSMAAMDYEGKVPQSAVAHATFEPGSDAKAELRKRFQQAKDPSANHPEDNGTKLEMVRHVMEDYLIGALEGNQLGIVSYSGVAYPQAFLTRDYTALHWVVDRGLTISSAPGEGSAMGKGLQLAMAMFDADSPKDHERLLVLFSDGGNDDDAQMLRDQARELKERGIKVIVVGMGNVMPSKIPVSKLADDDDFAIALQQNGKRWLEIDGQVMKTGMDTALLQEVANQSGGTFIHMQDMSDLNLLKYLGAKSTTSVPGTKELFPYLIGAGLLMLVLTFAATTQWQRRKK